MKYQVLAILLAKFGFCAANPIAIHEISSSNDCKYAPAELISICEAHKGSKSPFSYASISRLQGCILINDSTNAIECQKSVNQGKIYNVEKKKIESLDEIPHESGYQKTIASSTKAVAIISGINLVATIAGFAAIIFLK